MRHWTSKVGEVLLPPCLLIIAVQQPGTFKLFFELQLVPDNLLFIQCYPSNSLLHTLHLHFVLFQLKDCVAKQHPTLSWKPWHVHSGYYGFCTVYSNFPLWIPCPTIRQVPPYPNDFLYQHLSVTNQYSPTLLSAHCHEYLQKEEGNMACRTKWLQSNIVRYAKNDAIPTQPYQAVHTPLHGGVVTLASCISYQGNVQCMQRYGLIPSSYSTCSMGTRLLHTHCKYMYNLVELDLD